MILYICILIYRHTNIQIVIYTYAFVCTCMSTYKHIMYIQYICMCVNIHAIHMCKHMCVSIQLILTHPRMVKLLALS